MLVDYSLASIVSDPLPANVFGFLLPSGARYARIHPPLPLELPGERSRRCFVASCRVGHVLKQPPVYEQSVGHRWGFKHVVVVGSAPVEIAGG